MSDSHSTVKFCKKCQAETERYRGGKCSLCAKAYRVANRSQISVPVTYSEQQKAARRKSGIKWSAAHKDYRRTRYIKWIKTQKEWFDALKSTFCCAECGENDQRCLDFHHRNPAEKKYLVAYMSARGFSSKKILEEIAKCDVLCANCHRKHHATNG